MSEYEYIQVYADRLEKMPAHEFTKEISVLPVSLMLELALKRTPIQVYRGESMWDKNGKFAQESINYFELAKLLQKMREEK